ncbi:hypothetical protein HUO13_26130 [Saccharopolyspora erythraea]|uniref:hypothetical protein n=1 Tax=Saccharopolyspora erythraea TaxID=1836 RepID=UPI001BABE71B|nr:hypothetical protein [Saccharopolyspora erythraea]QUH03830.1 hypothetical protein HUO13_26130 [Saccharopolyspora erythraea]
MPFTGRTSGARPPIEYAAPPPASFDQGIYRERGPWWHTGNYIPAADPMRWTDAGPLRPDMHQHTHQWRRTSGGAHSDRTGLHSPTPSTTGRDGRSGRAQQRRPVRSLLTFPRFRGQSYSDTTAPVDRRGVGGG